MRTLGQVAYERFVDCPGVHKISGMLPWPQLHFTVQRAWEEAAKAVVEEKLASRV